MEMIEAFRSFLRDKVGTEIKQTQLAKASGVQQGSLSRFIGGTQQGLEFSTAAKVMEHFGISLRFPKDPEPREVCFVDARIVSAGDGTLRPEAENYLAVPLVGEVGAGPGIISQDEILSWVLVYRGHSSVQSRSNLLAVEIGRNQRSMIPTLHPRDIVLIDRNDWGQQGHAPPGNIFLVREPGQDGGGMVKRVSTAGKDNTATITFYSDNAAEYGPEVYHMYQYEHDIRRAVVGKVVWAWADLSRK
jgi:hypothetical protein